MRMIPFLLSQQFGLSDDISHTDSHLWSCRIMRVKLTSLIYLLDIRLKDDPSLNDLG